MRHQRNSNKASSTSPGKENIKRLNCGKEAFGKSTGYQLSQPSCLQNYLEFDAAAQRTTSNKETQPDQVAIDNQSTKVYDRIGDSQYTVKTKKQTRPTSQTYKYSNSPGYRHNTSNADTSYGE